MKYVESTGKSLCASQNNMWLSLQIFTKLTTALWHYMETSCT